MASARMRFGRNGAAYVGFGAHIPAMGRTPFDAGLLEAQPHQQPAPADFAACLNERGLYNTNQFVLRLSPRIHRLVDAATSGEHAIEDLSSEMIQAYSTYLHETIHWWQHVGSTSGLVLSLARPVQAHINEPHLSTVLEATGGHKSLKAWAEHRARSGDTIDDPGLRAANIAVNNAVDAEFFKAIVMHPPTTQSLQQDRYFESVGHCFWMAYGQAVALLAATVDRHFDHLPGGPHWDAGFAAVREAEVEGFVYQGTVRVAPFGSYALYEGQARMAQLQFLTFGLAAPPTIAELRESGYLNDIYGEAFEAFLKITGFVEPAYIDDPRVALFLLVVDLSINPTRGFPLEIEDFANFVYDTDPGIRFLRLSQAARDRPELAARIRDYTRDDYVAVGDILCAACDYDPPMSGLAKIGAWANDVPGVANVMRERETFDFDSSNLVVRVLFSHFVAFSQDKLAHPEFFCWAGAGMAGRRAKAHNLALFLRHLSLYTDQADDDGIFPRMRPGVDEVSLLRTLNIFYGNVVLYDLTRQWIVEDGPFKYDFSWLSQRHSASETAAWAKDLFANTYGVRPDVFDLSVAGDFSSAS